MTPARELLVVSSWAPPTIGGTPTVVAKLAEALRKAGIAVSVVRQHVEPEAAEQPSWPTRTLHRPGPLRGVRGGHYVLAPAVFAVVITRLLRRRGARVLLTFPEESFALPAAVACRLLRRPYALYMHNSFEEQALHPLDRLLARRTERWLLAGATPLLVLSSALADLYVRKHGLPSVIISHIVDPQEYADASAADLPVGVAPGSYALFSGDVYDLNRDALRRCVRAVRGATDLQLVVTGQKTRAELLADGIDADVVLTAAPRAAVVALQVHARVLLAPLAFESGYQAEVATALPTKVVEYVAAGAPILVHAPSGSILTELARERGWAVVVDEPDEAALAVAARRIASDEALRTELAARARHDSAERRPDAVARAFAAAVGLAV